MQPSRVGTVTVPAIATNQPTGFVAAGNVPLRVAVKNVGGVVLRIAFESASLGSSGADTIDHYQLIVGEKETFILAPRQTIYVAAVGGGGQLTYTASEALPLQVD